MHPQKRDDQRPETTPLAEPPAVGDIGEAATGARAQQALLAAALTARGLGGQHGGMSTVAFKAVSFEWLSHQMQAVRAILRQRKRMLAKTAVALLAAAFLVWTPLQRLLSTTSAQAVVNARILTIRAPIDGVVTAQPATLEIGVQLAAGSEILSLENARADRAPLDALQQARQRILTSTAALDAKRRILAGRIELHAGQVRAFREGRSTQLEKRIGALQADLSAARVGHATAAEALQRAQALMIMGVISQAKLESVTNEESTALQLIERLSRQKEAVAVELEAMRAGSVIGDTSNDIPQSAQRRLDDELQLAETDARLVSARTELADIEQQIEAETRRHAMLSTAVIRAVVPGRVWEVLALPGEHVSRGQDLLRIIDCANATVTAAVNETVYQRLAIGQRAEFRPRTGEAAVSGWITGLTGLAAIGASSAIHQSALSKEPYKVTLKFPELDRTGQCLVGRSGLVVFQTGRHADLVPPDLAPTR